MRHIFLFFALFCMGFATAEGASKINTKVDPKIRVLIAKEARGVLLESRGGYVVFQKTTDKQITKGSSKRFVAHALSSGVRWGEEYPDVYAISVRPQDERTTFFVDGMQYKGNIEILCTKKGLVTVVNEVSLDEYVKSILSLTMTSPLSKEAACALAIAARTNAFAKVYYREGNPLWDVNAKEVGYLGMGVTFNKSGMDSAIALTEKIVLEDKDGKPLKGVSLSTHDAETLAARGLDAKRILRNIVPFTEIGTTSELAQK